MKKWLSSILAVTLLLQSAGSLAYAQENPVELTEEGSTTPIVQQEETTEKIPVETKTLSTAYIDEVVYWVNQYRAQAGISPLGTTAALTAAAAVRGEELQTLYSHTRPDGTSTYTAFDHIPANTKGENIAKGQLTPADVVLAWMNSDGHRRNIMNAQYDTIGVGFTYDPYYYWGNTWAQLFVGTHNASTSSYPYLTWKEGSYDLTMVDEYEEFTIFFAMQVSNPLESVSVGGKTLSSPSQYTITESDWSTVKGCTLTFTKSMMKSLSAGTHDVVFKFKNGETLTYQLIPFGAFTPIENMAFTATELTIAKGATGYLEPVVVPSTLEYTLTSSDPSVATISASGYLRGISAGTTTITAQSGNIKTTCVVTVTSTDVDVTSVSLNKSSLSLESGETSTLSTTILPSNATNQSVSWTTSDSSVATVSSGKITAKSAGTATITATVDGKSATCTVTVTKTPTSSETTPTTIPVTSLSLNKSSVSLESGESTTLSSSILPSNATNQLVSWSTSNSSIATVSNGKITAKSAGTATITATVDGKSATCTVTVTETPTSSETTPTTIPVTSLSLNKSSVSLGAGESTTLSSSILPSNATNQSITWTTSDSSIAMVSNGVITAKSAGKATITAKVDGKTATCTVTVAEAPTTSTIPVTSFSLNKSSVTMGVGESTTLSTSILPSNATNQVITWSTSNSSVATVDNGKITAKGLGTATITATIDGKSVSCTVKVSSVVIEIPLFGDLDSTLNGSDSSSTITGLSVSRRGYYGKATASGTGGAKVSWSVSEPELVNINSAGVFTILTTDPVDFDITATSSSGKELSLSISFDGTTPRDNVSANCSFWAESLINKANTSRLLTSSLGSDYTVAITRAQIAEVLVNMVEMYSQSTLTPASSDTFVDASQDYVLKAYEAGIVSGKGDGVFSPYESATREEVSVMIYKAILVMEGEISHEFTEKTTGLSGYTDFTSSSSWAQDAIAILANNGIMSGTSNTTISPHDNTTIEECVLLALALFGK